MHLMDKSSLNSLGFAATGPTAGSPAAAWQSAVAVRSGGGVPAGSTFSTVQSAAMGGSKSTALVPSVVTSTVTKRPCEQPTVQYIYNTTYIVIQN